MVAKKIIIIQGAVVAEAENEIKGFPDREPFPLFLVIRQSFKKAAGWEREKKGGGFVSSTPASLLFLFWERILSRNSDAPQEKRFSPKLLQRGPLAKMLL